MKELLVGAEKEIEKRALSTEEISDILSADAMMTSRRIIGGYASVDVVDREGQRIPVKALKTAVKNFMENPFYKPVMIFHSDIQVGRILPKWTNPRTGETIETHVDETGWFVVCEIRDDLEVANKVWEEVRKGNLRSFSIAGSSKDKFQTYKDGQSFEQINTLEIYECTLCEMGVNPLSKYGILLDPKSVTV